jgi:hypothetical protein
MGKLSTARIRGLDQPGRYSDGDGLYLEVKAPGSGSWILRAQTAGKRRDIGLGALKNVSLAEARQAAHDMRRLLAQGWTPLPSARRSVSQARPSNCARKAIWRDMSGGCETILLPVLGSPSLRCGGAADVTASAVA